MTRKYFGTDGIRGRVGDGVMTPEFVLKLGWAAGKVLCNDSSNLVLIGKDGRIFLRKLWLGRNDRYSELRGQGATHKAEMSYLGG